MNKEDVRDLAKKFLDGTATVEEKRKLHDWSAFPVEDGEELVFTSKPESADEVKSRLYNNIQQHIDPKAVPLIHKSIRWRGIAAVAAVLILVTGTALFFFSNDIKSWNGNDLADARHIAVGKNTAVLTLANGREINLSAAVNGRLTEEAGVFISKTADGQLVYEMNKGAATGVNKDLLNSVSTPKGGQYQVVLPDGTKVWLNAASSIKFPTVFANLNQRSVYLTGEAYFEVAKDKQHPFIVQTDKQEVEVLGTHFNISAYEDEIGTKTTLLEGSIRILSGKESAILKPGQQAMQRNNGLEVFNADTEEAIAWKNGYFKFNSEPLSSIMRKLARWYDVDVVYEGEVSNDRLGGTISRYKNVGDVLEMLESTKLVKFKVEGRKIIVK